MRMREQKIYGYSELTGTAKEHARAWIIEGMWDFMQDELRDRFKEMLAEKGFPNAEVEFSLGHVQGDGVTFSMKRGGYWGGFELGTWLEAQGRMGEFKRLYQEGGLNITVQNDRRGFNPPRVSVEPTYSTEEYPGDEQLIARLEKAIQESIDDVCREMTKEGYEIIDFRESDEEVADHAEANEYEFDEKGRPA